ncbi:hypothetical protein GCM10011579_064880 [Streptomyces albiflavescens]|uniref:Uncharacterized protein n=1 Tax=Streptomyces albiflavescens TaxID=1623582 RepID=A0A917YA89_9ACTN|nr:hypothetical protein [Streptomyces albiflavescens]GGN79929.1 hypothetical protein GCM10011579_064880 [Streptomyces albiflavescens]
MTADTEGDAVFLESIMSLRWTMIWAAARRAVDAVRAGALVVVGADLGEVHQRLPQAVAVDGDRVGSLIMA